MHTSSRGDRSPIARADQSRRSSSHFAYREASVEFQPGSRPRRPNLEDERLMGIVARRQFDRRVFCLALGALTLSGTALAQSRFRKGLDGTWGGAQGDVTAQVIVSGNAVIGFFWRNDYLDAQDAKLSPDGSSLSFAFSGGHATLTRTGEETARIDITDGARLTHITLKRD
jgi:hypothetical protein